MCLCVAEPAAVVCRLSQLSPVVSRGAATGLALYFPSNHTHPPLPPPLSLHHSHAPFLFFLPLFVTPCALTPASQRSLFLFTPLFSPSTHFLLPLSPSSTLLYNTPSKVEGHGTSAVICCLVIRRKLEWQGATINYLENLGQ